MWGDIDRQANVLRDLSELEQDRSTDTHSWGNTSRRDINTRIHRLTLRLICLSATVIGDTARHQAGDLPAHAAFLAGIAATSHW